MGIELPAELADVAAAAGVQWPQADEEAMRASAKAWRVAGTKTSALATEADGTANKALAAVQGSAGSAAQQHWHTFVAPDTGHLTGSAAGCLAAADRLDHAADQVGAAKVDIVRHLVNLAKNTDAANSAAAASHPTALAVLTTAVHGTAANVAQVNHTLTTTIRLDTPTPSATTDPRPLSQQHGFAPLNQITQSASSLAQPHGDHGVLPLGQSTGAIAIGGHGSPLDQISQPAGALGQFGQSHGVLPVGQVSQSTDAVGQITQSAGGQGGPVDQVGQAPATGIAPLPHDPGVNGPDPAHTSPVSAGPVVGGHGAAIPATGTTVAQSAAPSPPGLAPQGAGGPTPTFAASVPAPGPAAPITDGPGWAAAGPSGLAPLNPAPASSPAPVGGPAPISGPAPA
ncbi:MAG TPA: hypothetical protein VH352_11765, partial [Pseudonocardiaceae bacterium]|nr:hypothetical protein [Pseudonocardiaceae bacterium]